MKPHFGNETLLSYWGLTDDGNHRTADLTVTLGGNICLLDVVISSPLQQKPHAAKTAASKPGAWADQTAQQKLSKYAPLLESPHESIKTGGLEVIPLAYDALGAPSKTSKDFLDRAAAFVPESRRPYFYKTATLLLSVALAKNTASILLERTEAALLGDAAYADLDLLESAQLAGDDYFCVEETVAGAADPVA